MNHQLDQVAPCYVSPIHLAGHFQLAKLEWTRVSPLSPNPLNVLQPLRMRRSLCLCPTQQFR